MTGSEKSLKDSCRVSVVQMLLVVQAVFELGYAVCRMPFRQFAVSQDAEVGGA